MKYILIYTDFDFDQTFQLLRILLKVLKAKPAITGMVGCLTRITRITRINVMAIPNESLFPYLFILVWYYWYEKALLAQLAQLLSQCDWHWIGTIGNAMANRAHTTSTIGVAVSVFCVGSDA